ncbi:MAG: T9SS type A sorting domain-containing protein, partial [Bacteroidetes bacterium]|nr:T9SS type A sorting domain-containing protein [Bacteroidota bacterium]
STTSNTVVATVGVDALPRDVAVTPDGNFAYVVNAGSGTVSVIATATDRVVATVGVGAGPFGVAITPDGDFAYVANPGSNTVLVIDIATNTVVATVSVGEFPEGIAITIGPVGVTDVGAIPTAYTLSQNYPNPFNPTTTINYKIPELSNVVLKLYDVLGNEVSVLVNEEKPIGSYEAEFNTTDLPSGVYFYQLRAGNFIATKKMVLLR